MSAAKADGATAATPAFLDAFADVSEAVESGAGLPEVARATERALNASVAIIDASSSVLAVACRSPEDERAVLADEKGSESIELKVADQPVGRLRYRIREGAPPPALLRMVATMVAQEVERARMPEKASRAQVGTFLADVFQRRTTDRDNITARGSELGCDLTEGASVIVTRAVPQHPEEGDWRSRVVGVIERGLRVVERTALAAWVEDDLIVLVPGPEAETAQRMGEAIEREIEMSLPGFHTTVARSRPATDPADLHRAGAEARLAANVAQAQGTTLISFEETGAYRLLLPAMSEDPSELQRFHDETVAPLVAYDEQYETQLVHTLESFLDADGNVARTSEKLFTHRHTIRYRLERVKELSGLDVGSTDGRERLGLGLKAMRVLGIPSGTGPASEAGAEAGRVPQGEKDR